MAAGLRRSFDEGFAARGRSQQVHDLFNTVLGLPPEVEPNSFLTLAALHDIASALDLAPGARLADLGCGRGGVGLWLSRHLDATLLGVDFSAAAVGQARNRRPLFDRTRRAHFWVADQAATGLRAASVDAALSVDAVQFSPDPVAALREARRILPPGARYVLTNWQPRDPADPRIPPRTAALDFPAMLTTAGFRVLDVQDRPDLLDRQQAIFDAALAAPATDDPALARLRDEATFLAHWPETMRRLLITAENPG